MRPVLARVPFKVSLSVLGLLSALVFGAGVAFGAPSTARTYDVQDGDTLYGIAAKLGIDDDVAGTWVKQVMDLNSLDDDSTLKVGAKLSLPDADKVSQDHTRSLIANAPAVRIYTVQDGDTLTDIAYASGVSVGDQSIWISRVLALNDLDAGDNLTVGQKLQLPPSPKDASAGNVVPVSLTTTSSVQRGTTTYKVQDGDTLSDIADKQGISDPNKPAWISNVLSLNNLDSPDSITVGATLTIPTASSSQSSASSISTAKPGTYTVKIGDTLFSIADANGIKDQDRIDWIHAVMNLNNLSDADTLADGQVLQIPPKGSVTGSSSTAKPPATTSKPSASLPPSGSAFFTVQPGDNLFKIASRLGIPPEQQISWIYDVVKLNNLKDATSLKDGQTLTMPATFGSGAAPSTSSSSSSSGGSSTPPASSNSLPSSTSSNTSLKPPTNTPPPVNTSSSSSTINISTATGGSGGGSGSAAGGNSDASQKSCFYVVQSSDSWDSIAKKLGISASKKDSWLSTAQSLNGISGAALPVGDAIKLPC